MIDIKKELEKNRLILLAIPSERYSEILTSIIKQLNEEIGEGIYITLNNPYTTLIKTFEENGVNSVNVFFIDAISVKVKVKSSAKNCIFVAAPNALTELSIAITKAINKRKPKVMIFDSLSTLLIYLPINAIIEFAQDLTTKLKGSGIRAIFPVIKNEELIRDMAMFVNRIIDLESEK